MKKIAVFIAFTSIFLSSPVYSAEFSFQSRRGLTFSLTSWVPTTEGEANKFMALANQDATEIKKLYGILVNESKTAKNASDKPATYEKLISRGLILEAGTKGFVSVLNDAIDKTNKLTDASPAAVLTFAPSKTRTDLINDISKILRDMNNVSEQTIKLVSGLNAEYEFNKVSGDPALVSKDKTEENNRNYKDKYSQDPDATSFIGKNKDKANDEVVNNLVQAGGGEYTITEPGSKKFSQDLGEDKFKIASADPAAPVTQQQTTTTTPDDKQQTVVVDNSKTDKQVATPSKDDSKELGDLKDELKKLKELQTKEKPKATDDSSKSSAPNASNPSLAGLRASYDADRAKREKEMAEQRKLQEAAKIIADAKRKSKLPKTKDIAFARPASSGGGSSLFSSPSYNKEDSKKDTSPTSTPSIFERNGIGASGKKVSDYSAYYGTANIPSSASSKELAMDRFSSMYEMARRKALIEDARSEFAGRYIDIFLLQHSIIYDYYSRGLLIDLAEAVEPIGDSDTL